MFVFINSAEYVTPALLSTPLCFVASHSFTCTFVPAALHTARRCSNSLGKNRARCRYERRLVACLTHFYTFDITVRRPRLAAAHSGKVVNGP
ncbi:unnamed protein product [Arctia plantaginis]|uniref:Uncharacterized protein n=1 Tax=Arctia plantaginis TaxID=874455 RepID=A0A8S1AKK9_ARCPL|nr:unnamed protein product [Arctia plantaginis]